MLCKRTSGGAEHGQEKGTGQWAIFSWSEYVAKFAKKIFPISNYFRNFCLREAAKGMESMDNG
jgi:hypothetical protein